MASIQQKIGRVRPPRVQITYDVQVGNAVIKKELPFVVGVLADLAGVPLNPLPKLKDRKFVEIDRDNFNSVMTSYGVRLPVRVTNVLGGSAPDLNIELFFNSMSDFDPGTIVQKVPQMNSLYQSRVALSDLLAKLDGNDALDAQLRNLIDNSDQLAQVQKELGVAAK